MQSLKQWRLKENLQNAEWERIKAMTFVADPDMKMFVAPKIGKIQEAIVLKLSENNPKIKSFRDVPPDLRDKFAQAIVASTLESFFGSMDPAQSNHGPLPQAQPQQAQQPQPLPQDEPQAPMASRG